MLVGVKRQHKFLRLVGANGAFRNQQRRMPFAQRNADARKKPGTIVPSRIRKNGAQQNAAGIRIQPIIERFDIAAMREILFVAELQFHRNLSVARWFPVLFARARALNLSSEFSSMSA